MKHTTAIAIIAAAAISTGCSAITKTKALAETEINTFHTRFNDGNFQAIADEAHPDLLKSTPASDFTQFLFVVHSKLGNFASSTNQNWRVNNFNLKTYALITESSTYENGTAVETFTFLVHDGKAQLMAYNINSRDLIMK